MATSITTDLGGIAAFDCHGDQTNIGPRWKKWRRAFELFVEGKGVTNNGQKKALLLHCGGIPMQDIFYTLTVPEPTGDETVYSVAIRVLEEYFSPQVNVPFERHLFRNMTQQSGETIDQFITRLRQRVEYCEFTNNDEQIRDQVIEKCLSHHLRRKLLEKGKDLTLKQLQATARAMETSETQANKIEAVDGTRGEVVNRVHQSKRRGDTRFDDKRRGGNYTPTSGSGKQCYRCGKQTHLQKDCPAQSQECYKCHETGHYARRCKTKDTSHRQGGSSHKQWTRSDKKFGGKQKVQMDLFGVSMVVPQIGTHARELGASSTAAGFIGSVYGALQLFSSPLVGRWSDVTSRKFCLISCLLMSAVGYLTMGFSYTLTILIFSRSITGMFKQSQSLSRSMLSDITPADQRCRVYGRFNSMSSVGFILGPLVSSTIIKYEGGFYIVSCLCGSIFILNAVLMSYILPNTAPTKKNPSQYNSVTNIITSFKHLNWTNLWDIFLINFFSGFSVMLFRSNSDMIFKDRFGTTKQQMSYLTSYTAVVSALCGFVSGWIADKYQNNYRLYQHMVCGLFVTLVALTLVADFWMYVLVLALLSFVTTNLRVASASLLVQRGGAGGVGAVMGLGDTVMSVARMLSPLLSGMALEVSSSGPPLMGSVMAGIAVTIIVVRSHTKLHQE